MTPLHNDVLIVLPATGEDIKPLHKEILSFLWIKTFDAEPIHKRRLVERRTLSASFRKGSLHIQHPEETADVLRINLIHKYHPKIQRCNLTKFVLLLEGILRQDDQVCENI
jgi:hypothetical protein